MYDLTNFTLRDMTECGACLRKLGGSASMEEVAQRAVRFLYENLVDSSTGTPSCVLVRFFKTHACWELDAELRAFADKLLGGEPAPPGLLCLILLASAGVQPEWNSRHSSAGHRAIPLPSAEMVVQMPMLAQLVQQFGLEVHTMLQPDPDLLVDLEQRTYNVFHVPEARGSPFVPGQEEFVIPFDVRSVLGFGGLLPAGLPIILFSRAFIPRETADLFRPLALSVKLAVLPNLSSGPVFAASGQSPAPAREMS